MSSISPVTGDYTLVFPRGAVRRIESPEAGQPPERVDSVELSGAPGATPYDRLPEEAFDSAKVERVRAALAEGSYLSPDKYDAAIDGLLADLDLLP